MSQSTTTAAATTATSPLTVAAQVVSVVGSLVRLAVRTR